MATYELDGSHVLLPPQVFLEARSCSRESVVEVHDNMDACIHQGVEGAHSPYFRGEKHTELCHTTVPSSPPFIVWHLNFFGCNIPGFLRVMWACTQSFTLISHWVNLTRSQGDAPPPRPGHEGVMENVEKRDLALFLPQHKENLKMK